MYTRIRNSFAFLVFLVILTAPMVGSAQEITGSVRGTVLTPSGEHAAGTSVTVTDTRTGSSRQVTANESGAYNVRGLTVGGPFTIRFDSDQYRGTQVTDVFTKLSGAATYNISLEEGMLEEVIVVASSSVIGAELAIGPNSNFDLTQISAMPTINRQIRDVIRLDPRVNISRSGSNFGISCLGGTDRANSFTIDGVRSADGFGLNASGNSARNTFPIPFDTVRAASVEFAPVDVQYGNFTGCNINVVSKSGSNEFSGSAFYLYNDDDLTGDSLDGRTVISEPFEDKNWGAEFSGPIIKDKLFFYVSYEETDEGGAQNSGPIGGGFANERFITVADANRVSDILSSKYGRDVGSIVRTLPQTSERKFARLDWNINDGHRVEFSYTDLEELRLTADDFGFNGFTFSDNFQQRGTASESYSLRLFSNWSDSFSTEVRASRLDVQDFQGPLGGGEAQDDNKPRIQVEDGSGDDILVSGPGFFRSANDLQYTLDQFKFAGVYDVGDHSLTAGYELDSLDVFNLFVANGTGTITFASIDDLDAGIASDIDANGSFTGDINDAAANFERDINTFYIQDKWSPSDSLTITAGLRYDYYDSDDNPILNPIFVERYGFTNTTSFNGLDILMPRLGMTYELPTNKLGDIQLRAGFGIFTGGDPTVHFANAFQNFGGAIGRGRSGRGNCTDADLLVLSSGGFNGLPPCIQEQQIAEATQNTGRADAVATDFELPSQQRWNFGATLFTQSNNSFLNEWELQFDYIYSNHKDSVDFIDMTLTQRIDDNGNPVFLPDGRPQFFAVDPRLPGCDATFIGPGEGFANVTAACNAGRDDQDILMVNGISGSTTSISFQAEKLFSFGDNTSANFRFGYAYTDSKVGNPVNSSTATSGFEEVATAVLNNNQLGPSVNANKHNFVIGTTFKHFFFEDHPTSIGIFFRKRSGRPFSYAYDNNTPTSVFGDSDNEERNLFYVPTGPNDPLVDLSALDAQGTTAAFFDFLERKGLNKYAGQVSPKNGFTGPWNTDVDIRISQDIPLPRFNHRLKFFFDIENVLNLLSDGNNIQKFVNNGDVGEAVPVMDARLSSDGTQFILSNFNPGGGNSAPTFNPLSLDVDDSVWRIQVGLTYMFN